MPEAHEIPRKRYYKSSEVCQFTNTQPYVLRFWESEFPQLNPVRGQGGKPAYRRKHIDLILRIKKLLYDEEYTIEGARKRLEQELTGEVETGPAEIPPPARFEPEPAVQESPRSLIELSEESAPADEHSGDGIESVARDRYEDALEEIAHLRLQVQEAEASCRKAENRAQKAEESADRYRQRVHNALTRLEKLHESLS